MTTTTSKLNNLTETLRSNLNNPVSSSEFELYNALENVLSGVGLSASDSGGKITFYGKDPIVPSRFRFGSMAAIGLAAKAVTAASIWKFRSGEGQDIHVDVRKALQRSAGILLSTSSSNKPWKYCLCNGKIVDTFLKPLSGHGQLSTCWSNDHRTPHRVWSGAWNFDNNICR